ncbi:MAG: hypothetical protein M3Q23_11915 [Actinomycetota bacterium]|nr:hypothetical protein [Actinomycetota bacterium]
MARFDVDLPEGFATGFGSVWVPGHHSETISRIDAATNEVVAEITGVGYQAQDVAVGAGSVWVPASGADYIARIDPATNKIISRLEVGAVSDVDFGFGSLWAATKDNRLLRIDATSERVLATLQIGPKGGNACNNTPTVAAHWVWANVCDTGMLFQVDPGTNRIVKRVDIAARLGSSSGWAGASNGGLWVVSTSEACSGGAKCMLARLDPDTGRVLERAMIDPERGSGSIVVDGGTLWLGGQGILTSLDAQSLKTMATYQVASYGEIQPGVGFGSVWITAYDLSEVRRFDLPAA